MSASTKLVIMGTVAGLSGFGALVAVDWRIPVGMIGLWLAGLFFEASKR